MAAIPWLADVLRQAGVAVVEEGNWRDRSAGGSFNPIGVLWHHTAGRSSPTNPAPSLGICINGRPDLRGPLCHALVDYHGVFHVISANRANHAGAARASGPIPAGDGNTMLIGWEIEYAGDQPSAPDQAMTAAQYDASVKATAAVLRVLGRDASYARGHRETSLEGKIDPSFVDLDAMRRDVAAGGRAARFAFANADGLVHVKDGPFAPWGPAVNGGGAEKVVLDGEWIGVLQNGSFHAKAGIHGAWKTMAEGGVRDIAIAGERFAFVTDDGRLLVKDGVDAAWGAPVNGGVATNVVLDGDWIAMIQDGSFLAKPGFHGEWKTMVGGNVRDIAVRGERFAFIDTAGGLSVKDGADAPWGTPLNGGVATRVALRGGWIGMLQGGELSVKAGPAAPWQTLTGGAASTAIALGDGEWFGVVNAGNFLAKQGIDSADWLPMAEGNQVTAIALRT